MVGETDNLVLEHLRYMRGKIDSVSDDVKSLSVRMGSIELRMASMERNLANGYTDEMHQNGEIDRLKQRVDKIEKRLELSGRD